MISCPLCNNDMKLLQKEIRSGDGSVYHCDSCDLAMLDIITEPEYYEEEYRKHHKSILNKAYSPEEMFNHYVNFQTNRISTLENYLNNDKKLLDIGCSAGQFIYNIKDKINVFGIEKGTETQKYCANKCNCKIYSDIDEVDEQFDIITIIHVLEHIHNPKLFIKKVFNILKDDGILYIEVPNINDVLISVYDLESFRKFNFHNAHLYYYSDKSLTKLLNNIGLTGNIKYYQDYTLFNHIHWITTNSPQKSYIEGINTNIKYIDSKHKNKISSFLENINDKYKNILNENGLSNNICFLGKKL